MCIFGAMSLFNPTALTAIPFHVNESVSFDVHVDDACDENIAFPSASAIVVPPVIEIGAGRIASLVDIHPLNRRRFNFYYFAASIGFRPATGSFNDATDQWNKKGKTNCGYQNSAHD